jgi:histidinol-phosphate aminotransferase
LSAADLPIREAITRIRPYQPGKPLQEVEREYGITGAVKLASNENPLGPSPRAVAAMQEAARDVAFYPEDSCFYLKRDLAAHVGLPEECLILGNGSDEILHCAGLAFLSPGDNTVMAHPSFVMYETDTLVCDAEPVQVPLTADFVHDLDAMLDRVNARTRLFFVCNPNNPTGTYVPRAALERALDRLPDSCLLVLDEAYYEYVDAPDYPQSLDYVREGRNLIVLRTFSKIYALAGLRVGYGMARADIVRALHQVRPPFNVNSLAQAAAQASLADPGQVPRSREVNHEGRAYLTRELEARGMGVTPTQANFIFIDTARDARRLGEELLCRGVVVRVGDWIFGSPTYIRVTIGTPGQNERFIEALDAAISATPAHREPLAAAG